MDGRGWWRGDPDPAREHRVQRNDLNADVDPTETGVDERLREREGDRKTWCQSYLDRSRASGD